MDDEERIRIATETYHAAGHAVQSGVEYEIGAVGDAKAAATPKHLRTGINMAMSDHSALATLLMNRGIFTKAEYLEALLVSALAEKGRYETTLGEHYGTKVVLV